MNTAKEKLLEAKEHFHGSDLEKIEEIYGIKKEDITSFSANVNPLGISPRMRTALWGSLPVCAEDWRRISTRSPLIRIRNTRNFAAISPHTRAAGPERSLWGTDVQN